MTDLLSFLGDFFDGLRLFFFWTFIILSLGYMFYVGINYILKYFLLITYGLLIRDKYFVAGMEESFNDHIWEEYTERYKEHVLYIYLFSFYRSLTIFSALAVFYSHFLFSNIFFPITFCFIFLLCLFKTYTSYHKRNKAEDNLWRFNYKL